MKTKWFVMALALAMPAVVTLAQDAKQPPPGNERPPGHEGGPGGPGGAGQRPPMSPIMAALDANGDGIIDADEIANASAALKKLDKNGDGKLTAEEYRPQRRGAGGQGPGGEHPRGPGGPLGNPDHPKNPKPPTQ